MRPSTILLTVLCASAVSVAPACAQSAMADSDLALHRGGFVTAGGVTLGFGAVMRTYVDGQLALEGRLTWTPEGAVTESGGAPIDVAAALAAGLDLRGLLDGQGVLLGGDKGATAVLQSFEGGVRNLIVNNADGRSIRQETELTLSLPDLAAMQRGYAVERLGGQISADIQSALLPALSR